MTTRQLSAEAREHIARLLSEAPPLTEQQRFKLAAIFRPASTPAVAVRRPAARTKSRAA